MSQTPTRRRNRRWAGVAAMAVVSVSACSRGGGEPVYAPSTPTPSPTKIIASTPTPAAPPVYPITRLVAPSAAAAGQPAVAVPVLTSAGGERSRGLESADAVWVSFPSTTAARALGIFQSAAPSSVAPVTTTRPVDAKLLPVTQAGLAYGGGPSRYVKQLIAADIPQFTSVVYPSLFSRTSAGSLAVSVPTARSTMSRLEPPRPGIFSIDPALGPVTTARTATVTVPGRRSYTLRWSPSAKVWTGDVDGLALRARNVIVQRVPYQSIVLPNAGGRTEANPDLFGDGSAVLMPAGRVVPGSWTRRGKAVTTGYVDTKANAVLLAAGSTWVLLVPAGTTVR